MMIGVRRLGFLILVTSSVLLATGTRVDDARTLDTGSHAKSNDATVATVATQAAVTAKMAKLPLRFEANAGQWDPGVRFRARQGGATLVITDDGMTIGLQDVKSTPRRPAETPDEERKEREKAEKEAKTAAVSIKLVGAKPSAPNGEKEIVTKSNFFLGSDPAKWRTNVANYAEVRAQSWLPGVDVVWHGGDSGLEYDLEIAAGVDARKIELEVQGAESLRVNGEGALEIRTTAGTLVQKPPRVVQNGRELAVRYRTDGVERVGLEIETYDPSSAVLVDPVLTYSTYVGGSGVDNGQGIAVDGSGNVYVTGSTSGSFPTTTGAYQATYGGVAGIYAGDAFVTKLNASGTALVYSTYLGGSNYDYGQGIAVDGGGNVYITGYTKGGFPTTTGAFQMTYGGGSIGDVFVTKLNAAGTSLMYSTYVGGSAAEIGTGIAVDGSGNAYVTGYTGAGFPTTTGAFQTTPGSASGIDVFVTKLNAAGTALVYSTYLGGSDGDYGYGIAVDGTGNAYITGNTSSRSFPTTTGAYQTTYGGGGSNDVFVTKLSASGTALVYSTHLGGTFDAYGAGIAVDGSGNAYVTGSTHGAGFPTTAGAFQTTFAGVYYDDAFVTKLNATGTALVYSTYLGGDGNDQGYAIAVDGSGNAYVTGLTQGSFPTTPGAHQTTYGGNPQDAFVTRLNAAGTALVYSTYLGGSGDDSGYGIALGGSGNAYITGQTSGSFPTPTGADQTTYGGGSYDVFVAEVSDPELANGTTCTQAGRCASDLCIDGVCCDAACTGQCQACDVTGHVGTCTPVTGAPHIPPDTPPDSPRAACGSTAACTATCDGTNTAACTYGPDVCASTCSNGTESDTLCDTAGACTVKKSHACNNLVCADANTCKDKCASNSDCAAGFACAPDGTCRPSGTCLDDHRLQSADNGIKDCSPYKCDTTAGSGISDACKTQCASVDDCIAPTVCDPNGKCVPPASSSGDSGGCSCDTSSRSNGTPPWGTAVLALSVASLIVRNRRRRPAA